MSEDLKFTVSAPLIIPYMRRINASPSLLLGFLPFNPYISPNA